MGMPQMQMPTLPKMAAALAPTPSQAPAGQKAAVAINREGGPLTVLTDSTVIQAKIKEIAVQIIGGDEGVDADIPLMQAGLTSNTAVLLRDELSKDIPGIKLPPTLMFD